MIKRTVFIPVALLLLTVFTFRGSSSSTLDEAKQQDQKNLPKTYDAAVDYLIKSMSKEDRDFFKTFPRCDFVTFHMGWGMGIRNGLGLWGGNDSLLRSCAAHVGAEKIHPDNASGILINGVWEKLNSDVKLTDFNKTEPDKYFDAIISTIDRAKDEGRNEYLASLPDWMYLKGGLFFPNDCDSVRNKKLLEEALKLANSGSKNSFLGTLYIANHGLDIKNSESLLQDYIKNDSTFIELPSFNYKGGPSQSLFILPDSNERITGKVVKYNWNRLSMSDFAVKCYGSLYDKTFNSVDDYNRWMNTRNSNYLVKWKYGEELTGDDIKTCLNDPLKLLQILLLTGQYFHFDEGSNFLYYSYYDECGKSIATLISFMGYQDKQPTDYPYNKSIEHMGSFLDTAYQQECYRAVWALKATADKLAPEEIINALSEKAVSEYNDNLKTEDLYEYKELAGFLMATEYEKILNYPDKNSAFESCYIYFDKEFISWPMKYFVTDLLFQIDPKRAQDIFMGYFKEKPTDGSFDRDGILSSIIRFSFKGNEEFIKNWFWTIQDVGLNYHPSEKSVILETLKETSDDTRKLYNEIINSSRFKK
jgi:hypothetical protein